MSVERYEKKNKIKELKPYRKSYSTFLPFHLTEDGTRTFLFCHLACQDDKLLGMSSDERQAFDIRPDTKNAGEVFKVTIRLRHLRPKYITTHQEVLKENKARINKYAYKKSLKYSALLLCATVQHLLHVFSRDLDYLTWKVWYDHYDRIKDEYWTLRARDESKTPVAVPAAGCTRCTKLSGTALEHHVAAKHRGQSTPIQDASGQTASTPPAPLPPKPPVRNLNMAVPSLPAPVSPVASALPTSAQSVAEGATPLAQTSPALAPSTSRQTESAPLVVPEPALETPALPAPATSLSGSEPAQLALEPSHSFPSHDGERRCDMTLELDWGY